MTLHDTLTTRLADLKAERAAMDAQIQDLERHVCMGRDWVVEHAEAMAEKFSHLFPAAIPEPLVKTDVPVPKLEPAVPDVVGDHIHLLGDSHEALTFHALPVETITYSDGTTATGVASLPEKSPAQQEYDDALDRMHG